MTNYSKRTMPSVSREGQNNSNDDWVSEFAKHIDKQSVESKRNTDYSIYDQISSIMHGNKPKYPSVEAAVTDMRERTGLAEYTKQLRAKEEQSQSKTANDHMSVELFNKIPQIKQTIDNYIIDTHGNQLVPEILDRIKSIHRKDVSDNSEWTSPSLLTYIYKRNKEEKEMHPDSISYNNLGKLDLHNKEIDPSNTDAMHILNPVSIK